MSEHVPLVIRIILPKCPYKSEKYSIVLKKKKKERKANTKQKASRILDAS